MRIRRMLEDAKLVNGRQCAVCGHVIDGYGEGFTISYGGGSWGIDKVFCNEHRRGV
jgi:hypothetical protein